MQPPEKTARPGSYAAAPGGPAAAGGPPRRQPSASLPDPPELAPLAAFIGTWRAEGHGTYPTIPDFAYCEEIRLLAVSRPFLVYDQRTWALDDRRPLHAEAGYWRPKPDGRIEILVAQATGMVEVDEGTIGDGGVRVASRAVASAATGPVVTSVERELRVAGDEMRYELRMEAVGQPLLVHLVATLRRVSEA